MDRTMIRKVSSLLYLRRMISVGLVVLFILVVLSTLEEESAVRRHISQSMGKVSSHFGKPFANIRIDKGIILNATTISAYTEAIFNTSLKTLDRLECPVLNATRYQSLRVTGHAGNKIQYIFPLNLRQNLPLLPTLLGAIIEAIRFLGPQNCILSIVEGNSPDGTSEVLQAIRPGLREAGITYFYQTTALDPSDGDRIEKLSTLRNAALQPVFDNPDKVSPSATVIFLNDVLACAEDVLELTLQLNLLNADMTCAMDWEMADPPRYYDGWVGRTISGDSFWDIPEDMGWDKVWDLFHHEPETIRRFNNHVPFQVFSCWNGGVAFRLQPLLEGLRFRAPNLTAGECVQGEPQLFCTELWFRGYGKIAVVPTVNFGYTKPDFQYVKKKVGFVSDLVANQSSTTEKIEWLGPPDEVKCIEPWSKQFWQPWNMGLEQAHQQAQGVE